jgi:hypothetical protein
MHTWVPLSGRGSESCFGSKTALHVRARSPAAACSYCLPRSPAAPSQSCTHVFSRTPRPNPTRRHLQSSICTELIRRLLAFRPTLTAASAAVAELDVLLSLAAVAREHDYCRPEVVDENMLDIKQGRRVLHRRAYTGGAAPKQARDGPVGPSFLHNNASQALAAVRLMLPGRAPFSCTLLSDPTDQSTTPHPPNARTRSRPPLRTLLLPPRTNPSTPRPPPPCGAHRRARRLCAQQHAHACGRAAHSRGHRAQRQRQKLLHQAGGHGAVTYQAWRQ